MPVSALVVQKESTQTITRETSEPTSERHKKRKGRRGVVLVQTQELNRTLGWWCYAVATCMPVGLEGRVLMCKGEPGKTNEIERFDVER